MPVTEKDAGQRRRHQDEDHQIEICPKVLELEQQFPEAAAGLRELQVGSGAPRPELPRPDNRTKAPVHRVDQERSSAFRAPAPVALAPAKAPESPRIRGIPETTKPRTRRGLDPMELGGLAPPTSWVRSTKASGELSIRT
jgi:hypothetical protein